MRWVTPFSAARNTALDALETALRQIEEGQGLARGNPLGLDVADFYVLVRALGYEVVEQVAEVVAEGFLDQVLIRGEQKPDVELTLYNVVVTHSPAEPRWSARSSSAETP